MKYSLFLTLSVTNLCKEVPFITDVLLLEGGGVS